LKNNNPSKNPDEVPKDKQPVPPINVPAHSAPVPSPVTAPVPARTPVESAVSVPLDDDAADKTYAEAIIEIKNIISLFEKKEPYSKDIVSVTNIVRCIENQNQELVMLADRATPDTYLIGHSVNACILSVMIGHSLGLKTGELISLGHCALLHDLGLADIQPLILKKTKYTPAELTNIQMHSLATGTIVKGLPLLGEEIKALMITVIGQVHERDNGSGYPFGMKNTDIHQFARIIAIADVYESLTHPRPYRERILPHNALKQMISNEEYAFDTALLKSFIEKISLYPPGSYVRLNTNEIGKVTETHMGLPTRPKVRMIIGSDLQRIPGTKIIDLVTTPMIFIKEAIDELALVIPDKKLMLELKAIRWWVRGL
jgi:HD-GYP domain-containing protein (c-di-GMP phosphodiesterase class II)